jgi:hypothetical protein
MFTDKPRRNSQFSNIENVRIIDPLHKGNCSHVLNHLIQSFYSSQDNAVVDMPLVLRRNESIALSCPFCKNSEKISSKIWYRKTGTSDHTYERVYSHMHNFESTNRVIITLDHMLIIKNVNYTDLGTYLCVDTGLIHDLIGLLRNNHSDLLSNVLNKFYKSTNMTHDDVVERFGNIIGPNLSSIKYSSGMQKITDMVIDMSFTVKYHLFFRDDIAERKRLLVSVNRTFIKTIGELDVPPALATYDEQSSLLFYVNWNEWSQCSTCHHTGGIRKRFGDCYVKYFPKSLNNKYLDSLQMMFYPSGWPCSLNLHHEFISNTSKINSIKNYIQYDVCNIKCEDLEKILKQNVTIL